MQRAAFVLRVEPGKEVDYIEAHKNVWPELIEAATAAGFHNHTVFMRGQTLFLYVEGDDIERSSKEYFAHPVKKKWDEYISQFLMSEAVDESDCTPGELEEVFHFD